MRASAGLDRYRAGIGSCRDELTTPALLLDAEVVRHNVVAMADWARDRVGIRPHVKTHGCVEIATMQIDAGACGLAAATVWEALAMAAAGFDDLFVANEIVEPYKLDILAAAARVDRDRRRRLRARRTCP